MKLDLGFESPYGYGAMSTPKEPEDDKPESEICYPSLTIYGKAAKSLATKLDAGDTFTATVTFRVTGVSDRVKSHAEFAGMSDRSNMDLEVVSMESGNLIQEEDEEETGDDAIDSFLEEKGLAQKKK